MLHRIRSQRCSHRYFFAIMAGLVFSSGCGQSAPVHVPAAASEPIRRTALHSGTAGQPPPVPSEAMPVEPQGRRIEPQGRRIQPDAKWDDDTTLVDIRHSIGACIDEEAFEELDRWAARLRKDRMALDNSIIPLEDFYTRIISHGNKGTEEGYQQVLQFCEKWKQARPESNAARIAEGKALICYGWLARGYGFAGTVTQDGWRMFAERVQQARLTLEEAAQLNDDDPAVYQELLIIGRAQGWRREEMDAALAKGAAIDPWYFPMYVSMGEALQTRWGGGPGELEQFALDTAESVGGEQGLDIYARIAARTNRYSGENVFQSFSMDKLRETIPAIEKRYPVSVDLISFAGAVACKAGDHETAYRLFETLETLTDQPSLPIPGAGNGKNSYALYRRWADPAFPRGQDKLSIDAAPHYGFNVSYSYDGKMLITSGPDLANTSPESWERMLSGPVRVWNAETGAAAGAMPATGFITSSAKMSPDGGVLALAGGGKSRGAVILVSLRQQSEPVALEGHEDLVHEVVFSADGNLLATGCHDKKARIFETATGELKSSVEVDHPVEEIAISSDGKQLATHARSISKIWDIETGEMIVELRDTPTCPEFLPDGSAVAFPAYGPTSGIRVFDLQSKTVRFTVTLPDGVNAGYRAFALSSNGRYAATGSVLHGTGNEVVQLWDLQEKLHRRDFAGHLSSISDLEFSPDGSTVASASFDGTVKLWQVGPHPDDEHDPAEAADPSAPAVPAALP